MDDEGAPSPRGSKRSLQLRARERTESIINSTSTPSGGGHGAGMPKEDSGSAAAAEIAKLQDKSDAYSRKLEMEARRGIELDHQIVQMRKTLLEQRRKMGGISAIQDGHIAITKQIKSLEKRLNMALVKFNEVEKNNREMRTRIESQRKQRTVNDSIYKKMEREINAQRREMTAIIDAANMSYAARDIAQQEVMMLKRRAESEQASFESDWKGLGKLIEEDRKRKGDVMMRSKRLPDSGGKVASGGADDEEARLKEKVITGNWHIASEKIAEQLSEDKNTSYTEAFERIRQATGIEDIDDLVATFLEAEDENYSLMNHVNELNSEMEKIEIDINEIREEIGKFAGQGAQAEMQRKRFLVQLDRKLDAANKRSEHLDGELQHQQDLSEAVRARVEGLFEQLGCGSMLPEGSENQVTEQNLMAYLGLIEQQTIQIVERYAAHQGVAAEDALVDQVDMGMRLSSGEKLSIVPPTTLGAGFESKLSGGLDDDDDDDGDGVLSRDEIKERAKRELKKSHS